MKIIVLNGSPKGELSVTMQYVAYLAKLYPQHEFDILITIVPGGLILPVNLIANREK